MVHVRALVTLGCAALSTAQVVKKKLGVTRFAWEKTVSDSVVARDVAGVEALITPQKANFSMPIDHFKNSSKYEPHSDGYFNTQYYFDASHYKPGGPVILLSTGEDSADDRIPFLQTGILYQLAKATNGIGVILEHRYYGKSFPVPDLSTKNMRFLSTEQALADTAYFAQHVQFPGVNHNVTASNTPWFAYGGSYAGAFVAFLRTLYPGVFWGSISSSGVTAAIVDYWQYFNPIIDFGPQQCIHTVQKLTDMADNIFEKNGAYNTTLRKAFGLNNVTSNQDVTTVLATPTGYWQARNWNPAISSNVFFEWCNAFTSPTLLYPEVANMTDTAKTLLKAGGYSSQVGNLTTPLLNWFGYVRDTASNQCPESSGKQDSCFALNNPANYADTSLAAWEIRSWAYQYCTQWGYYQTGSGRPKGNLGIISRLQDLPYQSDICNLSFGITKLADPSQINSWGGFDIKYPRLVFVGGEADPWRDATPLSEDRWPKGKTGPGLTKTGQPGFLIHTDNYGGVHHWDENGVLPQNYTKDFPPAQIQEVQRDEALVVQQWIKDWNACKKGGKPTDNSQC